MLKLGEMTDLGPKLKQARKTKRMRLKDVADAVGCSESLLSKIERARITPSLRMLHRIATVLDTSIGYLFATPQHTEIGVYRNGERPTVLIEGDQPGMAIRLERLVGYSDDQVIDGNIHVIDPGASNGGEIKHNGQEVGYVLEGELELTVAGILYQLRPGDSFFLKSDLPHSYRNPGRTVTRVVWINTPPTF
ncbi:cupin domain-containing protein [Rhodoligotrophos ferricapiens]|uniref:cupin domain-containing protein n=1 Tax=Rhodoligotrophos ferricapiens TaxID=3069264 RepID=UPI00315D6413